MEDFVLIPGNYSSSGTLEIIVANDMGGFYRLVKGDDTPSEIRSLNVIDNNAEGSSSDKLFGNIKKMTLSPAYLYIAFYSDDQSITVCSAKFDSKIFARFDTNLLEPDQLVFIILSLEFKIVILHLGLVQR